MLYVGTLVVNDLSEKNYIYSNRSDSDIQLYFYTLDNLGNESDIADLLLLPNVSSNDIDIEYANKHFPLGL